MIMPKKPLVLMKSQTAGGRSLRSCVMSQSSSIRHNLSAGPSRKACSSSLSFGAAKADSLDQSGRPRNSSASQPTVPASMAAFSVSDIGGNALAKACITGWLIHGRRNAVHSSTTATSRYRSQTSTVPMPCSRPTPVSTTSATATPASHTRYPHRVFASSTAMSATMPIQISHCISTSRSYPVRG